MEKSPLNGDSEGTPPANAEMAGRSRRYLVVGLIFLLALAVRIPFLHLPGFTPDQTQFAFWSYVSAAEGLPAVYRAMSSGTPLCNYPPLYPLVLRGLASVYAIATGHPMTVEICREIYRRDWTPGAQAAVWIYKIPAILADAALAGGLAFWIYSRVSRRTGIAVGICWALMPAAIYDSAVWGQVDALPILFAVGSLEMARRRSLIGMALLAALAVLTKVQMVVFAPIWITVLMFESPKHTRRVFGAILVGMMVAAILIVPFGAAWRGIVAAYTHAAGQYPYVHLNGFSAWFLSNPLGQPMLGAMQQFYVRDDIPVVGFGITPRTIGLIGLLVVTIAVVVRLVRRRCDEDSIQHAACILPLAFFVMATQMHERYALAALAAWAWSCRMSVRWCVGWLMLGVCCFVNAVWAWPGPDGAFWTEPARNALWSAWAGVRPGVACSLALIALLVWCVAGRELQKKSPGTRPGEV